MKRTFNKYRHKISFSPLKWSTVVTFLGVLASCNTPGKKDTSDEIPVNPFEINAKFKKEVVALHSSRELPTSDDYLVQLSNTNCTVDLPPLQANTMTPEELYTKCKDQVLLFAKTFKCNSCPEWHLNQASAFPITPDGVCVSNYHVFERTKNPDAQPYATGFVMDIKGNVYPVLEVLAASKEDDLAIFRVDCPPGSFDPIPLADDAQIGQTVHLISHPDKHYYRYSRGIIERIYHRYGSSNIRQSMSAEFAKGSSGAPILDSRGNVVAMVAGTQPVFRNHKTGQGYQMMINEIIPVSEIKKRINLP